MSNFGRSRVLCCGWVSGHPNSFIQVGHTKLAMTTPIHLPRIVDVYDGSLQRWWHFSIHSIPCQNHQGGHRSLLQNLVNWVALHFGDLVRPRHTFLDLVDVGNRVRGPHFVFCSGNHFSLQKSFPKKGTRSQWSIRWHMMTHGDICWIENKSTKKNVIFESLAAALLSRFQRRLGRSLAVRVISVRCLHWILPWVLASALFTSVEAVRSFPWWVAYWSTR